MSVWDYLEKNGHLEQLRQNYKPPFPLQVRTLQKDWIEEKLLKTKSNLMLDTNNPTNYPLIEQIIRGLLVQISSTKQNLQAQLSVLNYQEITSTIQVLEQSMALLQASFASPEKLICAYKYICGCLLAEIKLFHQLRGSTTTMMAHKPMTINEPHNGFTIQAAENSVYVGRTYVREQVDLPLEVNRTKTLLDVITQGSMLPASERLNDQNKLNAFISSMNIIYSGLCNMRNTILEDISKWKSNPNRTTVTLNQIQIKFQDAIKLNQTCRTQLSHLITHLQKQRIAVPVDLVEVQRKFLAIHLLRNSLLIELAPNQILRTGTNFKAKIRCLLGGLSSSVTVGNLKALVVNQVEMMKLTRISENSSLIQPARDSTYTKLEMTSAGSGNCYSVGTSKATTLTQKVRTCRKKVQKIVQATPGAASSVKLEVYDTVDQMKAVEIRPAYQWLNANEVEFVNANNNLIAEFHKAKVAEKGGKRDKQNGESVLYEKFYIIFHTEVTETINGRPMKWWIWTVSPKSNRITTNKVQDDQAFESLIWCNAADIGQMNSNQYTNNTLPQTLPWSNVGLALSEWFYEMTGAGLNAEHLECLKAKLFSVPLDGIMTNSVPHDHITRKQFCKTEMSSDKKFTFWQWFYATAKLTAEHFCGSGSDKDRKNGPWEDGKIMGFISRTDTQLILSQAPVGAFLLRFSDSIFGGISVAYVDEDNEVQFQEPMESTHLKARSLANHILTFDDVSILYPEGRSKKEMFGQYVVKEKPKSSGYVGIYVKILGSLSLRKSETQKSPASTSSEPSSTSNVEFRQQPFELSQDSSPASASTETSFMNPMSAGSSSSYTQNTDFSTNDTFSFPVETVYANDTYVDINATNYLYGMDEETGVWDMDWNMSTLTPNTISSDQQVGAIPSQLAELPQTYCPTSATDSTSNVLTSVTSVNPMEEFSSLLVTEQATGQGQSQMNNQQAHVQCHSQEQIQSDFLNSVAGLGIDLFPLK